MYIWEHRRSTLVTAYEQPFWILVGADYNTFSILVMALALADGH